MAIRTLAATSTTLRGSKSDGQDRAEEWRNRKIGARARRSEVAQGDDEKHKAGVVAQQAQKSWPGGHPGRRPSRAL